ncbi:Protein unc-93 A [Branchiostoma belcheri]|nr:Protein unc-93 A [Branchiostoma belcheri]
MNEHKIIQYATVYPKTTALGQSTKFDIEVVRKSLETSSTRDKIKKPREVVHYNPFELTIFGDVFLTRIDTPGKQTKLCITINGQNLDFFSLPEKPFTGVPVDLKKGIETEVNGDKVILECELEANKLIDPMPKVHFTTHFEEKELSITKEQVKEAKGLTPSESAVNDLGPALLHKAIHRSLSNILMAHVQDRKKVTESDAMLKLLCRLDGERKSVKEDKDEVQLKKMIDDATTLDDLMKNEDLFRVVEEILVEFGQYLEVKYPFKMANWLMRRRLRIGIRSFDEAGYKAILRMLIEELPSKQRWDTNAEDETVYGLERALHTKYKAHNDTSKARCQGTFHSAILRPFHSALPRDIPSIARFCEPSIARFCGPSIARCQGIYLP